jgi:hypothetical protein
MLLKGPISPPSDRADRSLARSIAIAEAEALLGDLRCFSYNYKYLCEGREKEEGGRGG